MGVLWEREHRVQVGFRASERAISVSVPWDEGREREGLLIESSLCSINTPYLFSSTLWLLSSCHVPVLLSPGTLTDKLTAHGKQQNGNGVTVEHTNNNIHDLLSADFPAEMVLPPMLDC